MTCKLACNLGAITVAAALVAGFWWQGERFIAENGPTFDEFAHLTAGYGYWAAGDFVLNAEHPPLLKLWWSLPLLCGDPLVYPVEVSAATGRDHWLVANALVYESGVSPSRLLAPARRMNLVIGCGVVLLSGWWAYRFWRSRLAGIAACAFAASDPTLQALSCVLSTDVGHSFFTLLTAYLAWEYAAWPCRGLFVALAVSLGLLLGSKFSAVGVAGSLAVAAFVVVVRGGVLVLPRTPVPEGGWTTRARLGAAVDAGTRLLLIAALVVAATYGFIHAGNWAAGLKFQLTRATHGDGGFYLCGEHSRSGWYSYFLTVLPLKLPIGLMIAAGCGVALLLFSPGPGERGQAWLLIPPAVFLALASYSRVDVGVRVVLPSIVFLYVIAASLAARGCCRVARLGVLVGCLGWSAWAGWQAAPHQLSYFNEIAVRTGGGIRYVADSNLDWGQGLPQLKRYMDSNGIEIVYLSYFGTDQPEAHGIRYQLLPSYGRVKPHGGELVSAEASRHVVAISANHLVGLYLDDPNTFTWLRDHTPAAVLPGGIYVFDLTGDTEAIRRVRMLTLPPRTR